EVSDRKAQGGHDGELKDHPQERHRLLLKCSAKIGKLQGQAHREHDDLQAWRDEAPRVQFDSRAPPQNLARDEPTKSRGINQSDQRSSRRPQGEGARKSLDHSSSVINPARSGPSIPAPPVRPADRRLTEATW